MIAEHGWFDVFLLALFIILVVLLSVCGDRGFYTPTSRVEISRKGCALSTDVNDVFVNIVTQRLPNGQVRCTIETLEQPK